MAGILAVLCISFLVAASAASARTLHQEASATAPLGPPSEVAAAILAAPTTANVSLFLFAFEASGLEGIINNETLVDGYTILAPTNEAVTAALPLFNLSVSQILSGRDVDRTSAVLATLLDYHILPEGAFTKAQLAGYTSLTPALTLFGEFPTAGNLTIIAPDAAAGNVTFVGADSSSATVVFPDILPAGQTPRRRGTAPASRKGQGSEAGKPFVLHIVDGVLLPPADVIANFTTTVAAGVPAGKPTVRNGTGSGPNISVPTGTGPIPGP